MCFISTIVEPKFTSTRSVILLSMVRWKLKSPSAGEGSRSPRLTPFLHFPLALPSPDFLASYLGLGLR